MLLKIILYLCDLHMHTYTCYIHTVQVVASLSGVDSIVWPSNKLLASIIPTNLSKTKIGTKSLKKRDFWSKIGTFLRIL